MKSIYIVNCVSETPPGAANHDAAFINYEAAMKYRVRLETLHPERVYSAYIMPVYGTAPHPSSTEEDEIYELASLEAAERDSPNSPDYERLVESISERIYNERHPS